MSSVLVLPSPLLPGSAYRDLAGALTARGTDTLVAPATLGPGEGAHDLVRRWGPLVAAETTLVAHSNAGYLAPLVRDLGSVRSPIVFMDAALLPVVGGTSLAPPRLRAMLAVLADRTGLLPPWTRWWPPAVMDEVLPPDRRDEVDRDCARLTLGYFDATVDAPPDWTAGPNAYLAFGSTYTQELDQARDLGWPCATLDGGHLHFMHHPQAVAAQIQALAATAEAAGGESRS